jgi:hypothetical protein
MSRFENALSRRFVPSQWKAWNCRFWRDTDARFLRRSVGIRDLDRRASRVRATSIVKPKCQYCRDLAASPPLLLEPIKE